MISTDLRLYEQLQQFTLFQGLSRSELLQMAGNTKFGFVKMAAASRCRRSSDCSCSSGPPRSPPLSIN